MKIKYKSIAAALSVILMMALLAGCDKNEPSSVSQSEPSSVPSVSPSTEAAGYYAIESMTVDGETFDVDFFEEMGVSYYIRLYEDYTMEINTDTLLKGTWENGELRYEQDGEEYVNPYELDGDLLTVTASDDGTEMIMVFRRGEEPSQSPDSEAGEAFVGENGSLMVGSYTINAEWIPFAEPYVVDSIFDAYLAVSGDVYYAMADEAVRQYRFEDGMLVFDKDIPLDTEYDRICTDSSGILYVSGFMDNFIAFQGDTQLFSHDGPDKVAMHPSGEWGISWFSGPDVEKITLDDGTIQYEDWSFPELDSIRQMQINAEHIFVTGLSEVNEEIAIFVYDLSGNLLLTLGDTEFGEPDSLGSITAVVETPNGYMGLDGNMRNFCFWKLDGTFIGLLDVTDLVGTSYPWLSTAVLMPDGSILVGMTQERDDESADEFLVYRLTGF